MHATHKSNADILAFAGIQPTMIVRLSAAEERALKRARSICRRAMDLRNIDQDSDEWVDCPFRSAAYAIDTIFDDGPWSVES